jgi:GTP cyclohydrolase I
MANGDRAAAAKAIDAFLRAIGRDPDGDAELAGTGARVADLFLDELCAGYHVDTRALLRGALVGAAGAAGGARAPSGLVVVRDVPVATTCPHHLLPATGFATVALHVVDRMVGLGTIASVVDAHARRLTLQETIGDAVAADLEDVLAPEWVAVRIVLSHGCMTARSSRCAVGSRVETIATRGEVPAKRLASVYAALGVGR